MNQKMKTAPEKIIDETRPTSFSLKGINAGLQFENMPEN